MPELPPLSTYVVTGFLGAGKTTLLNRILRDEQTKSLVIVNEFGEIGLDHLLISTAQDNILLLDSGCLCCELIGSLRETLADILHSRAQGSLPPFDRIVIETSGLADPAPILETLLQDRLLKGRVSLGGVIAVVDALHWYETIDAHPEARAQIAVADRIVITKSELTADNGAAIREAVARIAPFAETIDAQAIRNPVALLPPGRASIADFSSSQTDHRHDPVHHRDDIGSIALSLPGVLAWSGVAAWTGHLLQRYGDDLLRCKALVAVEGQPGPVLVQGVRRTFDMEKLTAWPDSARETRIVVIGRRIERADIERGLGWLDTPAGQHIAPTRAFPDE